MSAANRGVTGGRRKRDREPDDDELAASSVVAPSSRKWRVNAITTATNLRQPLPLLPLLHHQMMTTTMALIRTLIL